MSDDQHPATDPDGERLVLAKKVGRSLPQSKRVRFYEAWVQAGSPEEVVYSLQNTSEGMSVSFPDLDLRFSGKGTYKVAKAVLSGLRWEGNAINRRIRDLREEMAERAILLITPETSKRLHGDGSLFDSMDWSNALPVLREYCEGNEAALLGLQILADVLDEPGGARIVTDVATRLKGGISDLAVSMPEYLDYLPLKLRSQFKARWEEIGKPSLLVRDKGTNEETGRENMNFPQLSMCLNADQGDELSPAEWERASQTVMQRESRPVPHVSLDGWLEFTPLSCLARKEALVQWVEGYAKRALREGSEKDIEFSTLARKALRRAEVLMWRSDIFDQARYKAEAFIGATFQAEWLPAEPMLWLFQRPWYLDKADAELCLPGFEGLVVGQLIFREGDSLLSAIMGVVVDEKTRDSTLGLPEHGRAAILELNVPLGEVVGAYPSALHKTICAAEFLKQRVVQRAKQYAPRVEQRKAKKKGVILPPVSVIHLRRAEYAAPGSSGGGLGDSKEDRYSRRWVVRTHPRRQFYPKAGEHRVIWVPEHVKGPEDKPLIVRPTIYRADR